MRFLLVLVAVLQVCWLGETWWWTVATMAVGGFLLGHQGLRREGDDEEPADDDHGCCGTEQ